jgi:hypothetical protein
MSLVGSMLNSKKKMSRIFGGLFTFAISGLGIWVILVMISLETGNNIKEACYKFISQTTYDFLVVDIS